jgi:hypothetical protein
LALAYKHPVEFSKNNHTPSNNPHKQATTRGATTQTYPIDFVRANRFIPECRTSTSVCTAS